MLKVFACTASIALTVSAFAQWTVTSLHPAGVDTSGAFGGGSGQQAGWTWSSAHDRASLWSGTAASWIDLHPAGADYSRAYDADGGQQVGEADTVNGGVEAILWTGTAGSWTSLQPAGASGSVAYGVNDGLQAGFVNIGGGARASIWSGTAASWVDLHPVGLFETGARTVNDGQQVGWSRTATGIEHAALWSGSASSYIDLNPAGATFSHAYAVAAGQQFGVAKIGNIERASLWSGSADSWIDLNPVGGDASIVYDAIAGTQVGSVNNWAAVWHGTAGSYENLHAVLPGSWGATAARGVWIDGTTLFVSGIGFNFTSGHYEALLWSRPVPEPTTAVAMVGFLFLSTIRRIRRACS